MAILQDLIQVQGLVESPDCTVISIGMSSASGGREEGGGRSEEGRWCCMAGLVRQALTDSHDGDVDK